MKVKQVPNALEPIRTYEPGLGTASVSPDGTKCLFADGENPRVILWDLESGSVIRSYQIDNDSRALRGTEAFRTVSWSHDGSGL